MAQQAYLGGLGFRGRTGVTNPWQGLTAQQIRDKEAARRATQKIYNPSLSYGATGATSAVSGVGRQNPVYNFPATVPPELQSSNNGDGIDDVPNGDVPNGDVASGGLDVNLAGIWENAGMMADNEINPQIEEIDRLLQEAGYTAEDSQRAISEAYPIARRSIQKSIYENFVAGEKGLAAMGTGRGGGRQELLARAGTREATGLEAVETAKTRETGAIGRALERYRGQLGTQKTNLIGRRGALRAGYAEQLRGNRFNEAATMANINLGRANLAEGARQFNESLKTKVSNAFSGSANKSYDNMIFDPETGVYITYTQYLQKRKLESGNNTAPAPRTWTERFDDLAAKRGYQGLLGLKGNQIWNARGY